MEPRRRCTFTPTAQIEPVTRARELDSRITAFGAVVSLLCSIREMCALEIYEKMWGPEHSATATALNNLGLLLKAQGDLAATRPRLERPLPIYEKMQGSEHHHTAQWSGLEDFLTWYNLDGTFLFSDFGLAEAVFTPMFVRFLFLDYFEDFELPMEGFRRVRRWRDACLAHPAAQQVSREEVVKSYYDYALGVGNGALPPGRSVFSFAFEPHWSKRPWPPRNKFAPATDGELGLLGD